MISRQSTRQDIVSRTTFSSEWWFLKCRAWKKKSLCSQNREIPFRIPIQNYQPTNMTWIRYKADFFFFSVYIWNAIKTFTGLLMRGDLLLAVSWGSQSLCLNWDISEKFWSWFNTTNCTPGSAVHQCCWQHSERHLGEGQGWYFQYFSKLKSVHSSIWKFHFGFTVSILDHKSY